MFLFPIGRDNGVIQRHAWVTYGIIGLYCTAFFIVALANAGQERGYREDVEAISILLGKYPYLQMPKQLEFLLGKDRYKELQGDTTRRPARSVHKEDRDAQERLNSLVVSAVDHYRNLGNLKYGYIPAESTLFKVLISMWVQFSFMALVGDCLILFSTAPYVEDVFGRPAFALL